MVNSINALKINKYFIFVCLSGLLYGINGYFGLQLLNQHFSINAMLFWRFCLASVWMAVCYFFNQQTAMTERRPLNIYFK